MSDIDYHKLLYHPKRVSDWLEGNTIYPVYSEISVTSACNHRCRFCAPRFFLNYKPIFIDTETIKRTIHNMAECGVKAIMFGGEGEPLLHRDIIDIMKYTKSCGIDISLTTNGILFKQKILDEILPLLTWVKFSVDAGDINDYCYLHNANQMDFKILLDNISKASFIKRLKKYNTKIGVQAILFRSNINNMIKLARLLKYIKPDYFVVKPYSPHERSVDNELLPPMENQILGFIEKMNIYKNDYEFIYRDTAFTNVCKEKPYDRCYGKDFMAYITTTGEVYSCINYIGNSDFCYGNIYDNSFKDIWRNRKDINPNLVNCRTICRLDNVNRYLWKLKNPPLDVNFI